jgi:hypothetical protein
MITPNGTNMPVHHGTSAGTSAELVALLRHAAQIEHSLACQYLYAAWSLKRPGDPAKTPSEGHLTPTETQLVVHWEQQISKVAIQEMHHFLLANNLLVSLGAAPHLLRPNFPQLANNYSDINLPSILAPFSCETVLRFMCWEKPKAVGWWDDECRQCSERLRMQAADTVGFVENKTLYYSVGQLYDAIEKSFRAHPEWISATTARQQLTAEYIPFVPAVRAITSVQDAVDSVGEILSDGEGTGDYHSDAHFAYYHQIVSELRNLPEFEAGWPTVDNPSYDAGCVPIGATLIRDPGVTMVGRLFNDAYLVLIDLLGQLLAPEPGTREDRRSLANLAMALMPLVIKPLGILLTRLPAEADQSNRYAGPSFEIPSSLSPSPAGATTLGNRLDQLAMRCRNLSFSLTTLPARQLAQLAEIAATLETLLPVIHREQQLSYNSVED